MKKAINLICLVLFGVALSCATTKPITQSDLPNLKGKWEGYYGGGNFREPIELEIINENLVGSITWHGTPQGTTTTPFRGRIEDGKLVYSWGENNWLRLSLYKSDDGKMKLEGNYRVHIWEGIVSLKKVR